LTFAYAYGFRNIQNIIRKIKSKKEQYHMIEIMACPSGCINGGGQLKDVSLTDATRMFKSVPIQIPEENNHIAPLFANWLSNKEKSRGYLHTSYHAVEKTNILDVQW
jgi:iron only hydrogenase large subunit-like protein